LAELSQHMSSVILLYRQKNSILDSRMILSMVYWQRPR